MGVAYDYDKKSIALEFFSYTITSFVLARENATYCMDKSLQRDSVLIIMITGNSSPLSRLMVSTVTQLSSGVAEYEPNCLCGINPDSLSKTSSALTSIATATCDGLTPSLPSILRMISATAITTSSWLRTSLHSTGGPSGPTADMAGPL